MNDSYGKFDVELCKRQLEVVGNDIHDFMMISQTLVVRKEDDKHTLKGMLKAMKDYKGFYCRCKGCGKTPEELVEYKTLAEENGYESAEEAVREEEGTFNPSTGLFYCTKCYIKAGMPLGKA